jgi:fluoride exporter
MHQRLRLLALVLVGSAMGTLIRACVIRLWLPSSATVPRRHTSFEWHLVPWGLLLVNTVGCLVAGWLLTGPLRGSERPLWRAFAVPGILGGLTSYSALISAGHLIWSSNRFFAVLVVTAAVLAGLLAAFAGARMART